MTDAVGGVQVHKLEVTRDAVTKCGVQALAVAATAVAVTRLGFASVVIAVRGVAVLPESRVVVGPGPRVPGRRTGEAERRGDPASPADVDGVAVAVGGRDALEQQLPPSWLAFLLVAVLNGPGLLLAFGGHAPGGDELDVGAGRSADRARRAHHDRLVYLGLDQGLPVAGVMLSAIRASCRPLE